MPVLLLLVFLLGLPIAGCVPETGRSDGTPIPDAPLTLTALDVGHPTFPFRCIRWICAEGG